MKNVLTILLFITLRGQAQTQIFMPVYQVNYTVLRTIRLDMGNQFQTLDNTTHQWNGIGVDNTAITLDNNYTKTGLVTETNTASSISLTIPTHFSGTTGSGITPPTANTGVEADVNLVSAYYYNGTDAEPSIELSGFTPGAWLQIYCLGDNENYRNSLVYWHVGTTQSAQKNLSSNYGNNTYSEFDLANNAMVLIKNVQADGSGVVRIYMHQVSGNGSYWNACVIQETSTANPN